MLRMELIRCVYCSRRYTRDKNVEHENVWFGGRRTTKTASALFCYAYIFPPTKIYIDVSWYHTSIKLIASRYFEKKIREKMMKFVLKSLRQGFIRLYVSFRHHVIIRHSPTSHVLFDREREKTLVITQLARYILKDEHRTLTYLLLCNVLTFV